MKLSELKPGESARITKVGGSGSLRQHFLDMGLIPDAFLTLIKLAPMGDPMEFMVHGYELSIRKDDAAEIECEKEEAEKIDIKPLRGDEQDHPGLGEEGKYHEKKGETPLEEGETITFALAGNQNCGKTTLFNQLTGSNQHVGNFPGVTVDRKSGAITRAVPLFLDQSKKFFRLSMNFFRLGVSTRVSSSWRSRSFCSLVRWVGVSTTTVKRWLPRRRGLPTSGIPLPVIVKVVPVWVPSGTL